MAGPPVARRRVPARRDAGRQASPRTGFSPAGGLGGHPAGRWAGGAARGRVSATATSSRATSGSCRAGCRSCWTSVWRASRTTPTRRAGRCAICRRRCSRGLSAEEADDVWSLCVVLHEMVAGEYPFAAGGVRRGDGPYSSPAPQPRCLAGGSLRVVCRAVVAFTASVLTASRAARPVTARAFSDALSGFSPEAHKSQSCGPPVRSVFPRRLDQVIGELCGAGKSTAGSDNRDGRRLWPACSVSAGRPCVCDRFRRLRDGFAAMPADGRRPATSMHSPRRSAASPVCPHCNAHRAQRRGGGSSPIQFFSVTGAVTRLATAARSPPRRQPKMLCILRVRLFGFRFTDVWKRCREDSAAFRDGGGQRPESLGNGGCPGFPPADPKPAIGGNAQ